MFQLLRIITSAKLAQGTVSVTYIGNGESFQQQEKIYC